jgi:hypothetical protein
MPAVTTDLRFAGKICYRLAHALPADFSKPAAGADVRYSRNAPKFSQFTLDRCMIERLRTDSQAATDRGTP